MVPLLDLWLPIVVSAVLVFVVSSLVHMVLPLHKSDVKKMPGEEQVLAAMRASGVGPGQYMFPCASSMKDMGTPEMLAKLAQGPVGHAIVLPNGPFAMGKSLLQWFLLALVISACAGYLAGIAIAPGANGKIVFRAVSTAALLGYAFSHASDSIWKGLPWGITAKFFLDGALYALATGAAFAWLWPAA